MKYIEIKGGPELDLLSKISGMSLENIEREIFAQGEDLEILGDDQELAGKTILEILKDLDKADQLPVFSFMVFGEHKFDLVQNLGNLVLVSPENDCPQCGCEMERFTDSEFGQVYEVDRCLNPSCDYQNQTQKKIFDEWD